MSFTLFPQLPGEMRDSIWLAAIQPRIVTIRKVESELFLHVRSTTPIPPALHVCKDSRNLMVNAGYKLTFGPANPPNDTDSDAQVWFNARIDVLYVFLHLKWDVSSLAYRANSRFAWGLKECNHALLYCSRPSLKSVRRLALGIKETWEDLLDQPELACIFPNIEELLLVEHHTKPRESLPPSRMGRLDLAQMTQAPGGLWGIINIEMEDAMVGTGLCTKQCRDYMAVLRYRKETQTYGRDFYRVRERNLRDMVGKFRRRPYGWLLRVENGVVLSHQDGLPIPEVRLVGVVTKDEAQNIIASRERYWAEKQLREDKEAELGLSVIDCQLDLSESQAVAEDLMDEDILSSIEYQKMEIHASVCDGMWA